MLRPLFSSLISLALLVAGALVGNELAVALVHAQLVRLDDRTHARAVRPLAALFGRVMPPWYALTLVLTLAVLAAARPRGTPAWWMTAGAAALFAGSIAVTLVALAPINARVAAWDVEHLPSDWKAERRRWDERHRVRVAVLALAFTLLAAGARAA